MTRGGKKRTNRFWHLLIVLIGWANPLPRIWQNTLTNICMASNNRIVVDSNYFIALYNPNDALHEKAKEYASGLEREAVSLVVPNLVFSEIMTVLAQRRGREVAVAAGTYLRADAKVSLLHISEEVERSAWEIFQEVTRKDTSFVDCAIIAAMRAEGVSRLLTFDKGDFTPLSKKYPIRFYQPSTSPD